MTVKSHHVPMADAQQLPIRRRPLTPRVQVPPPAELRAWAADNEIDVSDRGRLSPEIQVAYCLDKLGLTDPAETP